MSKKIKIINCGKNWEKKTLITIKSNLLQYKNNHHIILTGGRYASKVYINQQFKKLVKNKSIILSDERITNIYKSTNKNVIEKTLKSKKILKPFMLIRNKDYKVLFCLLSLGEDGHFASIFPGDKKTIFSKKKYYLFTNKKFHFFKRVTISIPFLLKSRKIYILVNGQKKGHELNKIIKSYYKYKVFSKKLLLKFPLLKILSRCILLLDDKAFKEIKNL